MLLTLSPYLSIYLSLSPSLSGHYVVNVVQTIYVTAPFALSGPYIVLCDHVLRVFRDACIFIVISTTKSTSMHVLFSQPSPAPGSAVTCLHSSLHATKRLCTLPRVFEVFDAPAHDFAILGVSRYASACSLVQPTFSLAFPCLCSQPQALQCLPAPYPAVTYFHMPLQTPARARAHICMCSRTFESSFVPLCSSAYLLVLLRALTHHKTPLRAFTHR